MAALDRKLTRDLWQQGGQMLAIAAIMACGVAMFVGMLSTLESLKRSMNVYYEMYRFADVFASLERAPESLGRRIAAIDGVGSVETRVVATATLDVPGAIETVVGQLVSLPDHGRPNLNDVFVRRGRLPESRREIMVAEGFAEAHGLAPGATLAAVINGHKEQLTVSGVGLSPEFTYTIAPGAIMPDDRLFGVLWMRRKALATAFDMEGAFNNVALRLTHGTKRDEVIARLDELLEPWGGLGAIDRKDQVSNWYLQNELKQLRGTGLFVPVVFLLVCAFLLNIVFTRIVQTQREQIAVLKAFGYTNAAVGRHYLAMVMLVAVAGGAAGIAFGAWMGQGMTGMYTDFFRFPVLEYKLDARNFVFAVAISTAAAVLGTVKAIRTALRLPPAEAMRPVAPASYRPTLVERLGLQGLLPATTRMVLRHLERRPTRSAMSVLGIAMAAAIMVLGTSFMDAMQFIVDVQFGIAQREDVTLNLVEPRAMGALHEIRHVPGVLHAEPVRTVAARLRSGNRMRRVGITGLPEDSSLVRLIDSKLAIVSMPPEGLVLTSKLASLLGVRAGNEIQVEVLEGERPVRTMPVERVVESFIGMAAYSNITVLNRMMREGPTISGASLLLDESRAVAFHRAVKEMPAVAGVTLRREMIRSFEDTVQESMGIMYFFNILFGVVIAFGVVYNNARISLAEHGREMATLRVLGFSKREVAAIVLGELSLVTAVAIPIGLAIGYGLTAWMSRSLETELYKIPLIVFPATFALAAITVAISAVLSGLIVRRKLDRLDMMTALKTPE